MGAGASVEQVSSQCEGLGSSAVYSDIAQKCRENGIDAAVLSDLDAEGDEFDEVMAELGVNGAVSRGEGEGEGEGESDGEGDGVS